LTTLRLTPAIKSELGPSGLLRAGINHGNVLLASRDQTSGQVSGIAVDLAREIGLRGDLPVKLVLYDSAAKMADDVGEGAWDIAFLGADPDRDAIAFTDPYLEIEATYLVPAGSRIASVDEVDREGVRIAVSGKSAYDLFLSRSLRQAQLLRAPGIDASLALFRRDRLEALAGLRARLLMDAATLPGSRVLDGGFMAVQQAVGTPQGRPSARKYLCHVLEEAKASGLIARLIERHGLRGVTVAPAAPC
jgi:polar amino acid transport system substrate-binding protein